MLVLVALLVTGEVIRGQSTPTGTVEQQYTPNAQVIEYLDPDTPAGPLVVAGEASELPTGTYVRQPGTLDFYVRTGGEAASEKGSR